MQNQQRPAEEGIRDIDILLGSMNPIVQPASYYILPSCPPTAGRIVWQGTEEKGTTFVIEAEDDDVGHYGTKWKMITLGVHSSLQAIGFLSAILGPLASNGIAVNVLSGFYHDHLLVEERNLGLTIDILQEMIAASHP